MKSHPTALSDEMAHHKKAIRQLTDGRISKKAGITQPF